MEVRAEIRSGTLAHGTHVPPVSKPLIHKSSMLIVTAADIVNGYYREHDMISDGDVRIDPHLGQVRVRGSIRAGGSIVAGDGTGIAAGEGIKAGLGIKTGLGIKAGRCISAGGGIEAGKGINSGEGINAGRSIEASEGIAAGLGIDAQWVSCDLRIFAGLCDWRAPTPEEMEVRAEIRSGTLAHGTHVLPVSKPLIHKSSISP